jgi:hypothetical protein
MRTPSAAPAAPAEKRRGLAADAAAGIMDSTGKGPSG